MKAILSYQNYYSFGKNYQIKLIYNNEYEAEKFTSYLKPFKEKKLIKPYYIKKIVNETNINIIEKTNIPKNLLIPFISMLISFNNCSIIIGKEKFTSFNIEKITKAIDKLHINVTINKGNFFNLGDTYYVTFSYASDEQKDEISYYFNCKLNHNETNDMYPIAIDKDKNLTNKYNGTIIATNIPKGKISKLIKEFIEEYDTIVTINNEILKDTFDEKKLNKALIILDEESHTSDANLEKVKIKVRARY